MKQVTLYRQMRRQLWRTFCRWGRPPLITLAAHHGTDKLEHGYIDAYARWFAGRRHEPLNLLEIGVGGYDVPEDGGNSLRMWRDYFPRAVIHAIDIADKRQHAEGRVKIFQGSQADPAFLVDVARRIGKLDIVIDDGSHVSDHVIASFTTLFPLLAEGGIYVIEDLHTSYWPQYGGDPSPEAQATSMAMIKRLLDGLHHPWIPERASAPFATMISAVHAYPSIVFIMKGSNLPVLSPGELAEVRRATPPAGGAGKDGREIDLH